jgi:hypothetical protein
MFQSASQKQSSGGSKKRACAEEADSAPKKLAGENDMVIPQTGVRSGETIVGASPATRGTVMQVFFPDGVMYPPNKAYVEAMAPEFFRDRFNNVAFFEKMSASERREYCLAHMDASPKEDRFYLEDIPGTEIVLLAVGGDKIVDPHNPEAYSELMDGQRHSIIEFLKRIPAGGKTQYEDVVSGGMKAGARHSLSLRGSVWKLKPTRLMKDPAHFCVLVQRAGTAEAPSLLGGASLTAQRPAAYSDVAENKQRRYQCELVVPAGNVRHTTVLEVIDSPHSPVFVRANWGNLLRYDARFAVCGLFFERLSEEMSWFTPSIHKSLLQKVIRTRCVNVQLFNGDIVPAAAVVFASFVLLVTDGGSFVPDLRRFVRGAEAAFKRVGVAAGEDTFCAPEFMTSMLAAALAVQEYPEFQPSEDLVAYAIAGCMDAQADPRAWDYQNNEAFQAEYMDKKPLETFQKDPQWRFPFYLLATLGSFKSDIALLYSIAQHPTRLVDGWAQRQPLALMPIEYCLDQHSLTNIAYFFPPPVQGTYAAVFRHLWRTGTGRNARKEPVLHVPDDVATAQRLLWLSKSHAGGARSAISFTGEQEFVDYRVHWSWMAGMLEKIIVRVDRTDCHVFAHPRTEGKFVAIRPATREKAVEELSDKTKEQAIALAVEQLETVGKRVKSKFLGIEGTVTVRRQDDGNMEFFLDGRSWKSYCTGILEVDCVEPLLPGLDRIDVMRDHAGFVRCCDVVLGHHCAVQGAVVANWRPLVEGMLLSLPVDCLARLAMYVRPLQESIELYRISRDGGSTHLMTSWRDTVVFRVFMYLCALVPGVLRVDKSLRFHVTDIRLWGIVRGMVLTRMQEGRAGSNWGSVRFSDTRQLYAHQEAAVQEITERIRHGGHGNLMWIPVGLGKTLIVSSVVGWLLQNGMMPKYCVYALPPSAKDSVEKEFRTAGLPCHFVEYKAANKSQMLFQKHKINFIAHDNMRVAGDQMLSIAPDTFFVLDEFHLAMNDTQRTSVALEMAKLSHNFVGLTGTLIKDKASKGVIQWVSQVVEFEVTPHNFWVAIAALVSRRIPLAVVQRRVFHEVEMTATERDEYLGVTEYKFGGRARHTNVREALRISYEAINRGIVELTLSLFDGRRPVFVVAKDVASQEYIRDELTRRMAGIQVFLVSSANSITLTPQDALRYHVVITTCRHSTGFTLTQAHTMVTAIYYSNQATRDQLEGRILRLGQTAPEVFVHILHTGLLTYTKDHYEQARSLRESMEDLALKIDAKDVDPSKFM